MCITHAHDTIKFYLGFLYNRAATYLTIWNMETGNNQKTLQVFKLSITTFIIHHF